MRQLRGRGSRQRAGDISARQPLKRRRCRLDTPLDITARAVLRLFVPVLRRLFQLLNRQVRVRLTRFLQRINLALRSGDVCHLPADITDGAHLRKTLLLLLLVKYRADAVVRMLRIPAQVSHILLLVRGITDGDVTPAHCRLRRAFRMTAAARCRYHPTRQVALECITAKVTAAAEADTAVADLVIRLVVDIPEAQRSRIETVFVRRRRRGNHRTVKLRVASHRHIKAAFTREEPRLLLHRVIRALHFVLAGADVAGTRHAAEGEAAACRRAVLRRFIIVAVLLAAHPQVTPDIRNDFIATHLRAVQNGVPTAGHGDRPAAVERCFRPRRTVALFTAFRSIHVRKHADAVTALPATNADARTTTAAAVLAGRLLRAGCTAQHNVVRCDKRGVAARLQLAATDKNVAAVIAFPFPGRGDGQIISRIQRTARNSVTLHVLFGFRFLR